MAIKATLTTEDLTRLCIHAYNSTGWHSYYVFRPNEDDVLTLVAHTATRENSDLTGEEPSEDILRAAREELQGTVYSLPASEQ